MITRICARTSCGAEFSVRYPSDAVTHCSRRCAGIEKAGPKSMTPAEASLLGAAAQHRSTRRKIAGLVEGLGEIEAFSAGVRVALGYQQRLKEGLRGGELELLVLEATQE